MESIIRKLFLEKEIKSKSGVLHFRRWRILALPFLSIYIHQIYKPDEDPFLHDHPWNYFSLILKGKYIEQTPTSLNEMTPGKFVFKNATDFHKIKEVIKPTITLFCTGKRFRDWGYSIPPKDWIQHEEYRKNKDLYINK
jgi:hypothetical protein